MVAQGVNIPRLARLLRAMLAEPDDDGWLFGEEEGIIDGRRLAQLIGSPAERRVFRRDRYGPVAGFPVTVSYTHSTPPTRPLG